MYVMSDAHTWFARSMVKPRSRYGKILWPGAGFSGPAIDRLYPHPLHQCPHMPTADLAPLGSQQVPQHARPCVGMLQVQLVQLSHEREIALRHCDSFVVDAALADPQGSALSRHRQLVIAVDHRFALGNPALPSAASKKSFSSVSSPIFACSALMSTAGAEAFPLDPRSNTSAANSRS